MDEKEQEIVAEKNQEETASEAPSLVDRFKSSLGSFISKGKEDLQAVKNYKRTQLWKSVFRHKLDETPRNRALAVLTNVFLHLHPAKVNRNAVRFSLHLGNGAVLPYTYLSS